MTIFAIWVGIVVTGFCIGLWIATRRKQSSRFRTKLTGFFLLFVLVPAIPLTFFIANLLTSSANLLLLPRMGTALEKSIQTLRIQVEEKGLAVLRKHGNPRNWNASLLESESLLFLGHFVPGPDRARPIRCFWTASDTTLQNWADGNETIQDIVRSRSSSRMLSFGRGPVVLFSRTLEDSTVALAAYQVNPIVWETRQELNEALAVYNTLSLIKQSLLEKNIIWSLAALFVIVLAVLSVLTAGRIARDINHPIQDLMEGMKRVAGGDLSTPVITRAKDEFRYLVDSFNRMIDDLNSSRQKLVQAERKAAWEEVARRISHEIKNSLTPISLSLRRIRSGAKTASPASSINDSLSVVEDEVHALETMANEFSLFARLPESRKILLDINEIVRSVIAFNDPTLGTVRLETNLDPGLPMYSADREQFKRAFQNLILNAVEASHGKGTVTLSTRRIEKDGGSGIEIEVADQGEGMDRETLKNLFQPYFTTKKKGTGLGLAIVQKIVEDHGGTIDVESQKGKGTRIFLRFRIPEASS